MVFPTLSFLVFYLVTWPLAWATACLKKHALHKFVIIAASYVFYASWNYKLASVLLTSVVFNWFIGRWIYALRGNGLAKLVVALGVGGNLLALGFFKYFNFFIDSLNELLATLGVAREAPNLDIILPIGISFFTFQGISYIVDLYRRDLDRSRPLLDVMMFISFFPHLIAGPIIRASKFLPQLERIPSPDRVFVSLGVQLVAWGVFKKAVVANWLATELVDKVFNTPGAYGGADLLLAIYGYAIQIYCDFSAYSDIAIGIAALLGYRFQRNFDQPYRSPTLREFWRRWHISLSTWLRDYLYLPLGGSRHGRLRTYLNLFVTMMLGGLWHGASLNFLVWGMLHGGGLAIERLCSEVTNFSPSKNRLIKGLSIIFVFHFVCLCWIFFRAKDFARVEEMISGLADWSAPTQLLTPFLAILLLLGIAMHFTPRDLLIRGDRVFHRLPVWTIGIASGIVLLAIEILGGDGSAPFIYFQF